MRRIVFASHGSLGDLVPFLEIGKTLAARGHEAVVATHAAHRRAVEGAGLAFAPMRPDRPFDPDWHRRFMHWRKGPPFVYREFLTPAIGESDADLMAAVKGADVLVSVTLALAAPIVAARTGIAWLSAAFQPAMLYSIHDPPVIALLPFRRGRLAYNAWVLESAKKGIESWAAPLRAYRRDQGLGEYPDHPVFGGQHSPQGVLALYSPLFGPLPPDAPRGTVQTGQVLQTGGAPLCDELSEFLAAGAPPVVFTLGSASAHTARRFFHTAAAASRSAGRRAVLLVGREENRIAPSREVFVATQAPYQRVFPHAALTVHQGGIGTIALSLAAGVPMGLVPFAHDQPDNAARAARIGAARVISRWRYRIGAAGWLGSLLADGALYEAASHAAETLAQEAGAERAADVILAAASGAVAADRSAARSAAPRAGSG